MHHVPTCAATVCMLVSTLTALSLPAQAEPANAVPTYAAKPNLVKGMGRFWTAGTVSKNAAGQIVVGDYLGSDSSDADADGNVESVWSTGTALNGADVDLRFRLWSDGVQALEPEDVGECLCANDTGRREFTGSLCSKRRAIDDKAYAAKAFRREEPIEHRDRQLRG